MNLKRRTKIILVTVFIIVASLALLPVLRDREKVELSPAVRSQLTGSFIQLEEGFVHYELVGPREGRVVVLATGYPSPYPLWDKTLPALTGAGFRVLRYELFGAGSSDRPRAVYDEKIFVKQLIDLLKKLEIQGPVDLVGHSLGGTIAAAFCSSYPGMVRRMVLIAPMHEKIDISPLDIPGIGEYLSPLAMIYHLRSEAKQYFYQPGTFPDWYDIFIRQFIYKGFRRACLSTFRNFVSKDKLPFYQEMGKLDKPTLLIWGKSDSLFPFQEGVEKLKGILKAEVLAVDNASHAVHWEQDGIVNPSLIEFLSR